MAQFLAPLLNDQQEDANGNPLSGGKIYVYLAGTSTPASTTSDKAGLIPNAWPIVLNTLGVNAQGAVWLTGGSAYKFVIMDSANNTLRTIDNVSGINDTTVTTDQWVVFQGTPTFVSATSFTLAGDQTQIFQPGRRIKTTNTGGTIYSTIATSTYSAPNTTVTVRNDSGVLDSGLSQVSYGLISVQNSSVSGLLLGVTVYYRIAGVQNVSVDGGTPTTTGATTFTARPGATFIIAEAWGAGGGSGGNPITNASQQAFSSGGGGGSYGKGRYTLPLTSVAITVGAAGAAGAAGATGGTGGTTSIGALLTAPGGPGSVAGVAGGAVGSTAGTNGAAAPTGANIVAQPGGASLQILAAALGFISSQAGGASGSGIQSSYGAGAPGKYNGVSTASPQPGIAAPEGGLIIIWEYA